MRWMSRPQTDGDGTGHSRPGGTARELYQRSARRFSLRHADSSRTGLHATRRGQPQRKRRYRRRRLACLATDSARPVAGAKRCAADAARLRQRTELKGAGAVQIAWALSLSILLVGLFTASRADDQGLVAKGEYLARAGDCVACHTNPGGALFAGGRPMATP